ncbi:MAG TPA: hypothetical protein VJV78_48990 [Polyangiales bacterium]|nr:hypothetical protein [Polyangiales bacterium]
MPAGAPPNDIDRGGRALVRVALRFALLGLGLLQLSAAAAQSRETDLRPREFNIDLVTGPIIGPNSTMALGGAYTALGFGIDAAALTPVAYATRTLWDVNWFGFDITAGYSPGSFQASDFDNDGEIDVAYQGYYALTGGGLLNFGEFGAGGLVRAQNYRVGARLDMSLILANFGAAYSFLHGQLVIAGAARSAFLTLDEFVDDRGLAFFSGIGPEIGVLIGLAETQYRIGFAVRSEVKAGETHSTGTAQEISLPGALVLPAELQAGIAYQFGPRPLNRRWVNPKDTAKQLRDKLEARRHARIVAQVARERSDARLRHSLDTGPPIEVADFEWEQPADPEFWRVEMERYPAEEKQLELDIEQAERDHWRELNALSRRYLLLSLDVLVTAPIDNGIGLYSFLDQKDEASGRSVTVGLRFGAEGEPVPHRLKLRMGSYLEPSRFASGSSRIHGTLGADVKLFAWDMLGLIEPTEWRIGAAVDVAARYLNWGVSFGVWH